MNNLEKLPLVFQENFVTIACASSNEYVPYLSVYLKSIKNHTSSDVNYDIVIFEQDITQTNKDIIKNYIKQDNISIRFYNINNILTSNKFPKLTHNYNLVSYSILFIPYIFKNYDRIIFTDCDLIFNADPKDLYNIDLEDKAACAVRDVIMNGLVKQNPEDWFNYCTKEVKLDNVDNYFNSGVMVYDIKKLSNCNFTEKTIKISEYRYRIFLQDILNNFFNGDIKYLSNEWNIDLMDSSKIVLYEYLDQNYKDLYDNSLKNPKVYHWAGYLKPWEHKEELMAYKWWEIARTTPFYEIVLDRYYHKKFDLLINQKKYCKNKLKYFIYCFLSNFVHGKLKEKFKEKKNKYKSRVNLLKGK